MEDAMLHSPGDTVGCTWEFAWRKRKIHTEYWSGNLL